MASITELLSNIKTLLRKKYYLKEYEDIGLFVDGLINYSNGEVNVGEITYFTTTDITGWSTVSSYKVSDYTVPYSDYSVEWQINNTGSQLAIGNQNGWIFAINTYTTQSSSFIYTRTSNGTVWTETATSFSNGDIVRVEVKGTTISFYRNDKLILKKTDCKVTGYAKNIRIYTSSQGGYYDWIKIKPLINIGE